MKKGVVRWGWVMPVEGVRVSSVSVHTCTFSPTELPERFGHAIAEIRSLRQSAAEPTRRGRVADPGAHSVHPLYIRVRATQWKVCPKEKPTSVASPAQACDKTIVIIVNHSRLDDNVWLWIEEQGNYCVGRGKYYLCFCFRFVGICAYWNGRLLVALIFLQHEHMGFVQYFWI